MSGNKNKEAGYGVAHSPNHLDDQNEATQISPISLDGLLAEFEQQQQTLNQPSEYIGLLRIQKAQDWIDEAKKRPVPHMLFDVLWFEGELCILFAGSNQGKSILAVQIGASISEGRAVNGFRYEAGRQRVLYFDFELSDKQFETRYSNDYTGHYAFDDYFLRVEMNSDADMPAGSTDFDEQISQSIEQAVLAYEAKVLIIDNLTFLRSNETQDAKEASPFMKQLKALKKKHGLSLLILAHTPKRDQTRPITQNDLMGSARLMQFADSAFAIGASARDSSLKYLKQVKVRNTSCIFDSDNVALCQIHKPTNFLQLELIGYATEKEHLRIVSEKDTESRKEKAQELKARGANNSQIARELGISEGAVRKYFKA